jgi:phosphoglycolate phosphatase-like HAD superfamily hydrolase
MDQAQTRDHIHEHADAVVARDMDAILADFSEDLRRGVPQIVQDVLPQPVTTAEVLNIDVGDSEAVALIRCSGDPGEVTVRSRWQEQADRPVIVHAEPVS